MSYIDISIYVILALSLIFGVIRGFKSKRMNGILFLISLVGAYLLGISLARALMNTPLGYKYLQDAYLSILPEEGVFLETVDPSIANTQLSEAYSALSIPEFFQGLFLSHVLDNTSTIATSVASSFANVTMIGICLLILFLLFFILLKALLTPLWETVFGDDGKNLFGRIFGAVFQVAKGACLIFVLLFLITLIDELMMTCDNFALHNFLTSDLKLDEADTFSIGKIFYNSVSSLLAWIYTL